MRSYSIFILLLFCIASFIRSSSSSAPKHPFLGISPQDEEYYKSSDSIKCKDGSKKFTKSQLNDDFCDCPDGTDEPGTSACPTAKFYCRNAGHVSLFLFSSRVNDGICDCCDGSDEYDGRVKCPNACWEAGKVARDRLVKKINTYKEGVTLRIKEIEQAKIAIAKDEADLTKLQNEEKLLKGIVEELKERKEQIEKAEEKERLQKEKEENEKQKAEEALRENGKAEEEGKVENEKVEQEANSEDKPKESTDDDDKIGNIEDSFVNEDPNVDENEGEPTSKVETSDSSKTEAVPLNKEEEHAVKNKHESASPRHNDDSTVSTEIDQDAGSKVSPDEDKKAESDASETTEGLSREELGRLVASRWTGEETSPSSDPSWLEKIQKTVKDVLNAVNIFKTPVNISDAAHVRKEYDESSAKLSKIQSRISSLTQKLKHDFGPEKEFYAFYDRCFEIKQNKLRTPCCSTLYVYKVCPYKQASQEEGHMTTRLG
ncbi:hypothetical protein Gotur_026956 [Gossypium turneri]